MGVSVLIIAVGTLIIWLLLNRTAGRARGHYGTLLAQGTRYSGSLAQLAAAQRRLTVLRLAINAARYVLVIGALLMVLEKLGVVGSSSLLFPAGVIGAAIGLGAQNLIRDIVAGFFIVFEEQFAVGDLVSINGIPGVVEEVGLRVTRLRDDSAQVYFFPNGAITAVAKYPRRTVSLLLWVPLARGTDVGLAENVLTEVIVDMSAYYDSTMSEPTFTFSTTAGSTSGIAGSAAPPTDDYIDEKEDSDSAAPAATEERQVLGGWLIGRLQVHPSRAATVREKLPPRLIAALDDAGLKMATGASIDIINAPVG